MIGLIALSMHVGSYQTAHIPSEYMKTTVNKLENAYLPGTPA